MNVVELHVVILNDLCPLPLSHGKNLGPVVRKVDNGIHRINLYPVDNAIDFPKGRTIRKLMGGGRSTKKIFAQGKIK